MKKIKILTVIGTRPEIIRLSMVIKKLDKNNCFEQILVHTGQNYDYELNEVFFKDLEIRKPDYFLNSAGKNATETIGNIMIKIDPILEKIKPDAFLILGDTNSCLSAIPAKKRKIPIFHMEAGNRCFDQRVPEEINRKIVDHISDINLTYSDISREYLIKEGFPIDRIIKTGSPMFEILNYYSDEIKKSKILKKLNLKTNKYILVSAHREENIENNLFFKDLIHSLNKVAEEFNYPIIVSTHPRTRKKINSVKIKTDKRINFLKPMSFTDYNCLQINAFVVLSDSGTISEESSILKFPAVNIRESHERPEAMEETSVVMSGSNQERIIQAINTVINQNIDSSNIIRIVDDYSKPNVSAKVERIIISYIDYVNRNVWKRY